MKSGKSKTTKKIGKSTTRKASRSSGFHSSQPKQERKLWSPNDPYGESPYWTPPWVKVELRHTDLYITDMKGGTSRSKFMFTGSKVSVGGEFERLDIDPTNIIDDLEKAIDSVIKKHEKK